jgi:glycosyltransferase involved in cell wall biosynthesis
MHVLGLASQSDTWRTDRQLWDGVEVTAIGGGGLRGLLALRQHALTMPTAGIDIVHTHGVWDGASVAGALLAKRAGCAFVSSPHGMLEPWAFHHNRLKKIAPWQLWERRALTLADVLEAKSDLEASSFPKVGLHNQTAVIPVGLDIPEQPSIARSALSSRTCLFLSRIHPKKGIDMLLHGWAAIRPPGWRLVIAGPDDGGHLSSLQSLARSLGIAADVDYPGPQYGQAKWDLLRSTDLFVLPSHSENFGIVIPEALAMGVPCIATTGTPWSALEQGGMGWWVPPTTEGITAALASATALSASDLEAMGRRGVRYVRDTFSWTAITQQTAAFYRNLVKHR